MIDLPPLGSIDRVTFWKRDELTTDLICCEVATSGKASTFHEEMPEWSSLIERLEALNGFRADWFAQVFQPPFQPTPFLAYSRSVLT